MRLDYIDNRACSVNGESGYTFHGFCEDDRALTRVVAYMRPEAAVALAHRCEADGVFTSNCEVEVVRRTVAIVEGPDGRVHKVDPEAVRLY